MSDLYTHVNYFDNDDDELSLLAVFDFDDTLFPTTIFLPFIKFPILNPDGTMILDILFEPLSDEFLSQMSELDDIVENILNETIFYATEVIILTNARNGWVQLLTKKFYPKVHSFLSLADIQIIYARDAYGSLHPSVWKHTLLNHLYDWEQTSLLSVGDAIYDCEKITLPDDIIKKCVKFVKSPSVSKLIDELEELQDALLWLLQTDENLMIDIG